MIQESDEKIVREHLLGKLTEEELSLAEKRLLTDDDYFELLTVMEDELIDEYTNGDLTDEDRNRFEAFFLSTPERSEKLRFAQTLKEYVSQATAAEEIKPAPIHHSVWWKQPLSSPYLRLAAAAVIVIGLGLGIWRAFIYQPEASKGIAALNKAYSNQRPVESRITEFDYAPLPVTRGGEQENFDYVARDRAQALIQLEAAEHPTAQSYHDLGRLYLTQHEFDKAIDQFEKALKLDGKNAQIENDFGIALMEKGKAELLKDEGGRGFEDFARALEHFNKALELNGSSLEALFNRAILYQRMMLPQQAEEDWRAYLEKDPNSKWADEARQKLRQIEEEKKKAAQSKEQLYEDFLSAYQASDDERAWRVFSQGRLRTGNCFSERLLDDYLEMSAKGQSDEARHRLMILQYAAILENQRVKDRFTLELVRFYKLATLSRQEELVRARDLMKSGHIRFNQSEFDEAIKLYTKAKRAFERSEDACESMFAENWIGNCYLRIGDVPQSLSIFKRLSGLSEKKEYKWLFAQCLNALSDAQTNINEFSKALDYADRSLSVSKQIQDESLMLRNLQVAVSMYLQLNNYSKSLDFSFRAFALLSKFSIDPKQSWPFYYEASLDFYFLNYTATALQFQKEALWLALESKWPLIQSRSYARLGLIYAKVNNYDEAIRNGQLAFEEGKKITGELSRLNIMANSSLRLGHLYRQAGQASKALESYEQATHFYERLNLPAYLYETHKGKLLAYIAQGNDSAAKEELDIALEIFEQYRAKIVEQSNRDSFFDAEQSIYDLAINFEYSIIGNPRRAFEFSEICRARSLLDIKQSSAQVLDAWNAPELKIPSVSQPLTIAEIQAQLPERTTILQYSVLNDKLLVWFISRTRVEIGKEDITIDKLSEKIFKYLALLTKATETSEEMINQAKELHAILVSPIQSFLDKDDELCIVPDKSLHFLPYNALISPDSGKYLIEDHKILLSPSSSLFISCSDSAKQKIITGNESLLSIGQPYFDHSKYPSLDALPSTSKEAKEIADCYHPSSLFIGEEVRKSRVKSQMQKANVIHVASHYVVDEKSPMLSKLLITREGLDDESLHAYEIYQLKLPQTRLVVLAACQTGIERSYRGEGAISIARSFISAGVPLVVASLWPIDSNSTTELMTSFHKHRKHENLSTAEALRQAQLDAIRGPDQRYRQPYYWASFNVIGGHADF